MTVGLLPCPPGVALLISDPAHERAIRSLWTLGGSTPKDLPVQEWKAYGRAWLTAQTVKVDLLELLQDCWMASWGEALARRYPGCRFLPEADLIAHGVDESASEDILDWVTDGDELGEHVFFVAALLPDQTVLETSVWVDSRHRLGMWIGSHTHGFTARDPAWKLHDDTGYARPAVSVLAGTGIDVSAMADAARAIVACVR